MTLYCPHCGFPGTGAEVDEHRATGVHNDRPQAGSNLLGASPMSAAERLSPKDTAVQIRRALRAAFPGVKFSLTLERGTGWGYMNLTWTDGPTTEQVEAVTNPFRSERASDEPDDSVRHIRNGFTCKGVLTSRRYSPAALDAAATQVADRGEYDRNLYRHLAGKALA